MTNDETIALLEKSKEGDREALGELLTTYRSYIIKVAKACIGARSKARMDKQDIAQLTCSAVIKKLPDFRGSTEKELRGFIAATTRNVTSNVSRSVYAAKRTPMSEATSSCRLGELRESMHPRPVGLDIEVREEFAKVKEAMAGLSENMRKNLEMHYLKGLSYSEISEITGQKTNLIRASVCRGLKVLRSKVGA